MKIIKCSLFNVAQYISHRDLLSNLVASLYSRSFSSKSEYWFSFITFWYFGLNFESNLELLLNFNLVELLKLKLNIIFFLALEPGYIFNLSPELFWLLEKFNLVLTFLNFCFISFLFIILILLPLDFFFIGG